MTPQMEAWHIEECKYIVADLEAKLRAGRGTKEELAIARDMLEFYKSELEAV
jgi:hypothetical protein